MSKRTNPPKWDPGYFLSDGFVIADTKKVGLSSSTTDKALLAILDATHSGYVNGNFFFYLSDAMRETCPTWVSPYQRPVQVHHMQPDSGFSGLGTRDMLDPIGRVIASRFLDDDRGGFTQLDARITDPDAKEKIRDGRYLTVSTRIKPIELVECSICGVNLLKDGFCGHSRGSIVEDEDSDEKKLAYWKIGRGTAREVSFINIPADQSEEHAAGIVKWNLIDSETPNFKESSAPMRVPITISCEDQLALPSQAFIKEFEDSPNPDLIVNKSLWESLDGNLTRYAEQGGLTVASVTCSNPSFSSPPPTKKDPRDTKADNTEDEFNEILSMSDEDVAEIEITEDDLKLLDWLADAVEREFQSQPKKTAVTDKVGSPGKVAHAHVVQINEAGNGMTDWVLGHAHQVVNNKILTSTIRGRTSPHDHKIADTVDYPWWHTLKRVTGYNTNKSVDDHKHVVRLNAAGNGHTDYVLNHNHQVVGDRIMIADSDPDDSSSKGHAHKMGEKINVDTHYLDQETWDIVRLSDAKLSEKTKKKADKAGKTFCGPHDKRKNRRSFPAYDCPHVRAGLRLLSRYKGAGSKAKIRACLMRQNRKLGCGVSSKDQETYDVLALVNRTVALLHKDKNNA